MDDKTAIEALTARIPKCTCDDCLIARAPLDQAIQAIETLARVVAEINRMELSNDEVVANITALVKP